MGQCSRSDTNLSSSLLSMARSQRHASWLSVYSRFRCCTQTSNMWESVRVRDPISIMKRVVNWTVAMVGSPLFSVPL